jgi:hypothetical protein
MRGQRVASHHECDCAGKFHSRGDMKEVRLLSSFAVLSLAGLLALGGCNKNNEQQQAGNQTSTMPGVQSSQTAAGQPGPEGNSPSPDMNAAPGGNAAPDTNAAQQGEASAPPQAPPMVDIPAGTRLRVRLNQALGSKINRTGDSFGATLADDVVVNGITVIPRGARAEGTVIDAKPLGRFKGGARLEVRLERVRTDWGSYPVSTSTVERTERGKGRRSAKFIGGGGGLGALIGGLAGGGRGVLIGAAAGAGAGAAGTAFTGNRQIVLPTESLLTFRLEHTVHVSQ